MKNVFSRAVLCVAMIAAMSVFVACSGSSDSSVTPSEVDESSSSVAYSSSSVIPSTDVGPVLSGDSAGVVESSDSDFVERFSSSSVASCIEVERDSSVNDGSEYDSVAKTLTDLRDSQVYRTVTIGTQTWMAENLNYAYNEPTSSLDSSSFCYSNSADSCAKYGRLYLWSAAMDSAGVFSSAGEVCDDGNSGTLGTPMTMVRGVCPAGWHLPSDNEWNTLLTAVGGVGVAGRLLRATSDWDGSVKGVDSFGFSLLPAGEYDIFMDYFDHIHTKAHLWSSSEYRSYYAFEMYFSYHDESAGLFAQNKYRAQSVRCLLDFSEERAASSSSADSSLSANSSSSIAVSYGTLTDDRDNQVYKTVTIDTQTWMAENLNYNYNEGSAKSYCYNNSADSCDKYGRLYLWSAAMDSAAVFSTAGKGCGDGKTCASAGSATLVRGVCPAGWHLPNDDEWSALFAVIGGVGSAGTKLKSTSGWQDGGDGSDSFGLAVLPAGYRYGDGDFGNAGYVAYFWSSSNYGAASAYKWNFAYNYEGVNHYIVFKDDGLSVRCLRDSN